jgi:hypothetical protein
VQRSPQFHEMGPWTRHVVPHARGMDRRITRPGALTSQELDSRRCGGQLRKLGSDPCRQAIADDGETPSANSASVDGTAVR